MDEDITLIAVIAGFIIVVIVLIVWMKSRGRRRVVNVITPVQEALGLIPYIGGHPQLDTVWHAVRGQVSGLPIRIFAGKSRGSRKPGSFRGKGAISTAVDSAHVMIVVSMPNTIPFHINIQRKSALSSPTFGTSYSEFDRIVQVVTENERKTLTLLNDEQLRAAIISFIKIPTAQAFITSSEVMIRIFSGKQVLPAVNEAVNLANILGQQIERIH
jgi:glutaredoxin-related protein